MKKIRKSKELDGVDSKTFKKIISCKGTYPIAGTNSYASSIFPDKETSDMYLKAIKGKE